MTYQGRRWEKKKEKRPDDKWVAITIDPMAYSDVTEAELQTLMEEFNKSGYTFFLGAFATGGPIITGYGPFGTSAESAVFYFQLEGKAMAEDVASIVSKVLSLNQCKLSSLIRPLWIIMIPGSSRLRILDWICRSFCAICMGSTRIRG